MKETKEFDVVVGVSVNPEMELSVKDTQGPKKVLQSMSCCLSGSSGNVATAIKKLGGRPHLLGLVAKEGKEMADMLLEKAVAHAGIPFTPIPVLSETSFAAIPVIGDKNGEVWGKKGQIVQSALPHALREINGPQVGIRSRTFTVVTGLREVEIPFAKALLFQARKGFRVLNAKDSLCASKEFKKILPLVDLLVLNRHEFVQTGMRLCELHSLGPRIVVVTLDVKGGFFSFRTGPTVEFSPMSFHGGRFETGAGDWFLGGMISELKRLQECISTTQVEQFQNVVNFSAKVAGKKITMAGGGNGPSRQELN